MGSIQSFTISTVLSVWFLYMPFTTLMKYLLFLVCCFYHEWLLDFVRYFFRIYRDDHVVFFFISLVWCITLIDFCMSNQSCILGINPSWYVSRFGLLIFYWGCLHLYSQEIVVCCVFSSLCFFVWCTCLVLVSE